MWVVGVLWREIFVHGVKMSLSFKLRENSLQRYCLWTDMLSQCHLVQYGVDPLVDWNNVLQQFSNFPICCEFRRNIKHVVCMCFRFGLKVYGKGKIFENKFLSEIWSLGFVTCNVALKSADWDLSTRFWNNALRWYCSLIWKFQTNQLTFPVRLWYFSFLAFVYVLHYLMVLRGLQKFLWTAKLCH
jgi:hypothetical protein